MEWKAERHLIIEVGLRHGEEELVLVGGSRHGKQRGRRDQRRRRPLPHQRRELEHLRSLPWLRLGCGELGDWGRRGLRVAAAAAAGGPQLFLEPNLW